jgi:very-short-patch-repair endonuclease
MQPDDVVLVALMNQVRDLELARREHWYRVPICHAPKFFAGADYIAFYLTRAFGEQKWAIHEYAPVRGHELVTRHDLFPSERDHPRANEQYYRLALGPLQSLARPIVSKRGRRLLFIWTTGEKFMRATEINDLLGTSPTEDKLWEALKDARLDAERQVIAKEGRARYRVDFLVYCPGGRIGISLSEAPIRVARASPKYRALRFTPVEVENRLDECVAQIKHTARELGIDYKG